MSNPSDKKPFSQRPFVVRLQAFVDLTLLASNMFILYISGLLVIMGALLMLGRLSLHSWEQATLTSLILGGLFAVASALYAAQTTNQNELETSNDDRKDTLRIIALLVLSGIVSIASWGLTLFPSGALIVLIWQAVG